MTITNPIRATLDSRLASQSGLPEIFAQNVRNSPTTGTPFLRTTFIPVVRRPAVRGQNPQQKYEGLYTILICTPEGEGSGLALEIADTLLGLFDATLDIQHPDYPTTNVIVTVDRSEVDNSFLDSPFYCTPVNVFWYTYH